MGRVYSNERDLPDDPNRVGDEDYGRKWWLDEPDPDEGRQSAIRHTPRVSSDKLARPPPPPPQMWGGSEPVLEPLIQV